MGHRTTRSLVVAAMWIGAATACELPASPVIVVTTTAASGDAEPGDGVCEASVGVGDCTLRAAIEEGNALGRAELSVPTGRYGGDLPSITGDLGLNRGAVAWVELEDRIHVAPSGTLWLEGVWGEIFNGGITVEGTLVAHRISFHTSEPAVEIVAGGTAVLINAFLSSGWHGLGTVTNDGRAVIIHSDLVGGNMFAVVAALQTRGTGTTTLRSSVLMGQAPACVGLPPTSEGHNVAEDDTCGLATATDLEGVASGRNQVKLPGGPYHVAVAADAPGVDTIPLSVAGCGGPVVVDLIGSPRPLDGNGDAAAACDSGSTERIG